MAPGPELASLVTAITGPGGAALVTLTCEEIFGVLGAVQRLAAWAARGELEEGAYLDAHEDWDGGQGKGCVPGRSAKRTGVRARTRRRGTGVVAGGAAG